MVSEPYKVIVVLDSQFGEKITALPPGSPVWIVGTHVNRAVVERLWKEQPEESHLTGITVFNDSDGSSAEDLLVTELDTIDLHHGIHSSDPPYTILEVHGTSLTERIESGLVSFGFNEFTSIPGGFRAVRLIPGESR
jgi:hypothetical protein